MKNFILGALIGALIGSSVILSLTTFLGEKDTLNLNSITKIETTDSGSLITTKSGDGYYFENYDYQK